eukprot:COSAG02_NODE_6527_length_3518_cov_40.720679_3_plen_231_part_00
MAEVLEAALEGAPGGAIAKVAVTGAKLLKDEKVARDPAAHWAGFSATLFGQTIQLLPPVFVALVRRLCELDGALEDPELFVGLPSDEPGDDVREYQRCLFPKVRPPSRQDWPGAQWATPPMEAATLHFDSKKDKGKVKNRGGGVDGRTSGDATLADATRQLARCVDPKHLAELLLRWVREREDVQIPPAARDLVREIGDAAGPELPPSETTERLLAALRRREVRICTSRC